MRTNWARGIHSQQRYGNFVPEVISSWADFVVTAAAVATPLKAHTAHTAVAATIGSSLTDATFGGARCHILQGGTHPPEYINFVFLVSNTYSSNAHLQCFKRSMILIIPCSDAFIYNTCYLFPVRGMMHIHVQTTEHYLYMVL